MIIFTWKMNVETRDPELVFSCFSKNLLGYRRESGLSIKELSDLWVENNNRKNNSRNE